MTSRRKQIRPIKASCQSLEICETKNLSISEKFENPFPNWQPCPFSESTVYLENKEETKENVFEGNCDIVVEDKKIDEQLTELTLKEPDTEPIVVQTLMEESLDEISKKMNKDEAKILPFQSSGGVDFFKCPLCDQSYICGRESLTIHLQEHQNKTKREDGKHLCCLCSKELSSNSSLERHLLTHSNHRPFSCYMCDKKFTTNGNLSRHMKTSHTNNETIESSIDEVLKKHQSESDKSTHDISTEIKTGKYKKPTKPSRKDFHSTDMVKSDCRFTVDQDYPQPCMGLDDHGVSEPMFKAILPANMNFFPPLLSLNINELSFLQTNHAENLNFLHSRPTSIIPNVAIGKTEKTVNQFHRKNRFDHLKSITVTRHRKTKHYLNKLEMHLNRVRKIKSSLK